MRRIGFTCLCCAAGLLLLLARFGPEELFGQQYKRNGSATVELQLKLSKSDFAVSEDREMTVTVTNRTAAPVEIPNPFHSTNWQPTYTIQGPSYPQGYTFSFRSVALKDKRPDPGVPAVLVKLAPGEKLEKDVPIADWAPIDRPGAYQIVARLRWKGLSIASEPARFNIAGAQAQSVSVGVDVGVASALGEWVEWFNDQPGGRRLYTALFKRPMIDVHGYKTFSVSPLIEAGAQATDLLSPWTNYDRQEELAKWRAWREGSTLVAFAFGQAKTQRLQLGAAPRLVIRPALMTANGDLDVLAIGAEGALLFSRFSNFDNPSAAPRVLWRLPVSQVPPAAGRAALSSEASGSRRLAVLVSQDGPDLAVRYLNARDGREPGAFQIARIVNARVIPNTEPALRMDSDGVVHAAFPFQTGSGRLAIADLRFGVAGNREGEVKVAELGPAEARPKAAAAGYVVAANGSQRRDWVVLLENGNVIYAGRSSPSRRLPSTPVLPLQLVLLEAGTYLLTVDAAGAAGFALLD
jgi:hypothetical protein